MDCGLLVLPLFWAFVMSLVCFICYTPEVLPILYLSNSGGIDSQRKKRKGQMIQLVLVWAWHVLSRG